jgi:hypothetical protein
MVWNFLIAVDQLLNVLLSPVLNRVANPLYRFGDPDETLSSVMGKNVNAGVCRGCYYVCRLLHLLDPGHCEKSIEMDEGDK